MIAGTRLARIRASAHKFVLTHFRPVPPVMTCHPFILDMVSENCYYCAPAFKTIPTASLNLIFADNYL